MRKIGITRKIIMYGTTLVLVACHPLAMAGAQEATTPTDETTAVNTPESEPEQPQLTYTYNPDTGHWDSEKWRYNPATNSYETPPAPTIIEPPVVDDEEVTDTSENTIDKTVDTTVNVENDINSDAMSGDATVSNNTAAGNATTGDAAATATLLNVVNSTIGLDENAKVASFTQDILGDVKGDIILSPLLLKAMLEAEAAKSNTTINANTNLNIDNNINLSATSGDAAVTGNTSAGNATSGSATAMANVVNILNSMIATQQSFIGTINIYGNLEGDILIAPDFIPQMIANNGVDESEVKVSNQDTQTIVNNISAVAETGAASVFGNTSAGNASSGDALSNVVIFNLSGHEVIAKNSLLVFVNVLGKWVGVIVDAPEGATAAMVGNGVTSSTYQPDLTVNSKSNQGITNTIAVNAQSGDATVAHNTSAGNAVTGSAKALANVANVTGNQFSMSDWFGVLFINVFQSWYGSFGIDTPYGNTPETEANPQPSGPIEFRSVAQTQPQTSPRLVLIDSRQFAAAVAPEETSTLEVSPSTSEQKTPDAKAVLGALKQAQVDAPYDFRLLIIAGSIILIGASAIGIKRLLG